MSELFEKMKAAQTVEEVLDLAAENGLEMTAAQAKEFFEQKDTLELADEDLAAVAGGLGYEINEEIVIKWVLGERMNLIWALIDGAVLRPALTARNTDIEALKNFIRREAEEFLFFPEFRYRARIGGQVTVNKNGWFSYQLF